MNSLQTSRISRYLRSFVCVNWEKSFLASLRLGLLNSAILCPIQLPHLREESVKDMLIPLKTVLGTEILCSGTVLECNCAKYFSKKMSHFETWVFLLLQKGRKNLLQLIFSYICEVN